MIVTAATVGGVFPTVSEAETGACGPPMPSLGVISHVTKFPP